MPSKRMLREPGRAETSGSVDRVRIHDTPEARAGGCGRRTLSVSTRHPPRGPLHRKRSIVQRQADLERARAQLKSAQSEVEAQKRQRAVLDSQELQLRAAVEIQKAALALARTNLSYTKIVAPEDGIVSERLVRPGQLVSPGTQVISLVQNDSWVQANFLENQIRGIKRGDAAEIRVDAIPGVLLRGHVEEVAPASGSQFALLPPDNATGNFTKIAQRIPVKIVLDRDQANEARLRPGLSVVVRVRTNGSIHDCCDPIEAETAHQSLRRNCRGVPGCNPRNDERASYQRGAAGSPRRSRTWFRPGFLASNCVEHGHHVQRLLCGFLECLVWPAANPDTGLAGVCANQRASSPRARIWCGWSL